MKKRGQQSLVEPKIRYDVGQNAIEGQARLAKSEQVGDDLILVFCDGHLGCFDCSVIGKVKCSRMSCRRGRLGFDAGAADFRCSLRRLAWCRLLDEV
jgi:hypothetical protein